MKFQEKTSSTRQLFELHPAQQNIHFEQLFNPDSAMFNFVWYTFASGELNPETMQQAWVLLNDNLDTLRLVITEVDDGLPLQYVADAGYTPRLEILDCSNESDPLGAAQDWMQHRMLSPMDTRNGEYCRAAMIKLNTGFIVCTCWHHYVMDGIGAYRLHELVHRVYQDLLAGADTGYLENIPQYAEAAKAGRDYLESQQYRDDKDYWSAQLKNIDNPRLTPLYENDGTGLHTLSVEKSLEENLRGYCLAQGISLLEVFCAIAGLCFAKMLGSEQLILATTVHGRSGAKAMKVIGMHSNVVPLPCQFTPSYTFDDLTRQFADILTENRPHRRFPSSHLVRLQQSGDGRLADIQLIYDKFASPVKHQKSPLQRGSMEVHKPTQPLLIRVMDHGGKAGLELRLGYSCRYFDSQDIERCAQRMIHLLTQCLDVPRVPLKKLSYLLPSEVSLLDKWNQTEQSFDVPPCLHQWFEQQVEATPRHSALIHRNCAITYQALNHKANHLAKKLKLTANTPVALFLEPGIEMVVAILAVLKAGGAYVPIATKYPETRVDTILKNTAPAAILTQPHLAQRLPMTEVPRIEVNGVPDSYCENIPTDAAASDLAYIIYTSGTSGQPKGVMVEHHSVCNLVAHDIRALAFCHKDHVLCLVPYQSDAFVQMLFLTLLTGATLVMPDEQDLHSGAAIAELIAKHQVTTLTGIPSHLYALGEMTHCQTLQRVILGGESGKHAFKSFYQAQLINEYGPTECSVKATQCLNYRDAGHVNIMGKPITNVRVYVLSPEMSLLPIGAVGELYIGGAGVARGYYNNPKLTASVFVQSPFGRLYKTGDLVRWDNEGRLIFCGRNDAQLKIRGYRVEPAEIEKVISDFDGVKQAVVINSHERVNFQGNSDQGQHFLAAYIIAREKFNESDLRYYLSERLPEYMVPGCFITIESIPLTQNGKLDKNRLPPPAFDGDSQYVAPATQEEKLLCRLWREVLALGSVSTHCHFLRLGGDSISALRLVSLLRNEGYEIKVNDIFAWPILAHLAEHLGRSAKRTDATPQGVSTRGENKAQRGLSFSQQSMLFVNSLDEGQALYPVPLLFKLRDAANISLLVQRINQLVARHVALRTVFPVDESGARFVKVIDAPVFMHSRKLESCSHLMERISEDVARPFTLATEPALKLHHYKTDHGQYLLMLFHHIGIDGWSLRLFINELKQLYLGKPLTALEADYFDYARWQKEYLQESQLQRLTRYWSQQLDGYVPLSLPLDKPRPARMNHRGKVIRFELDEDLSARLRKLALDNNTTLNNVMLCGWCITLSVTCAQSDIVIGTPSDNRQPAWTESIVGFLANTLALRVKVEGRQSVAQLLKQVHQTVFDAKDHQALPFEKLVDVFKVERDPSCHPVFQVLFGLHHFDLDINDDCLPIASVELDIDYPAMFDLSLFVNDGGNNIKGVFSFAAALFERDTVSRMSTLYQTVLQRMSDNAESAIGGMDLLSLDDKYWLEHCNRTDKVPLPVITLHGLFERQVVKTPGAVALTFNDQHWRYKELDDLANQLATKLKLDPETPVALCFERGPEWIIAILAVLKAGCAYVPLSPRYPARRIQTILQDAETPLVLTSRTLFETLNEAIADSEHKPELLALDYLSDSPADKPSVPRVTPESLAYIIYTSGTTGQPKGVMVEHKAVVNTILSLNSVYDIAPQCRQVGCFSDFVFDVSISEIFNCLGFGGQLHLFDQATRLDPLLLKEYILREQLNYLFVPPVVLAELPKVHYPSLKAIVFAGERCDPVQCRYFSEHYALYNYYGPTEAAVYACGQKTEPGNLNAIGKPLANVQLYVFNDNRQRVPVGVRGELYIGGRGLARGYRNLPALTEERFVETAFGRLYRTGDIVRYLPDGNLEYIGRNDFQVKIRGFRVELGEVEAALSVLPSVEQALVIAREHNGETLLVAYVKGSVTDVKSLADQLSQSLPHYMIPVSFSLIDEVPLTINGKLDRSKLPEIELLHAGSTVAPRNERQRILCHVFAEVLGVEQIGIDDNFFAMGGNSILSVRLVAAIARTMHLNVPLALVFEQQTVAGLSEHLGDAAPVMIPRVELKRYPLTFAQQRLLFIERFERGSDAYHMPYLVKLYPQCDVELLVQAINDVLTRHWVLKSVFVRCEDSDFFEPVPQDMCVQRHVLQDEQQLGGQVAQHLRTVFDLTTEAPIRLHHYNCKGVEYLLIIWHHIAFDGWSIGIFMDELTRCYGARHLGELPQLPELDISYGDYAAWQRDQLQGETLDTLLGYWQGQLNGFENLNLPLDKPRPLHFDYRGDNYHFTLDAGLSERLRALAGSHQTTLYNVMLSGLFITLSALSGQQDIVVGSPSDNRHHPQTQALIGFFVNALVLRTRIDFSTTIKAFIAEIHHLSLTAKIHQELPFEQLVEALGIPRETDRHVLFQVMFTVQDFADKAMAAEGLPFEAVSLDEIQPLYAPAKFDLTILVAANSPRIACDFNYAARLFERQSIDNMARMFVRVLTAFVENVHQRVGEIELLEQKQKAALIALGRPPHKPYPDKVTLHELFEQCVARAPEKIALKCGPASPRDVHGITTLTYRQLDERANRLAGLLHVKPGEPIALYMERSIEMIVAMLAVLKAGGAYLPVSTDYPKARVEFVFNDARPSIIICDPKDLKKINVCVACLDYTPITIVSNACSENAAPKVKSSANDLAYILYTSGTTGAPKGVMTPHRAVVSLVQNSGFMEIGPEDSILHFSDPGFDAATLEIWSALTHGATLVVAPSDLPLDAPGLGRVYRENQISISFLTRSLFDALYTQAPDMFSTLKYLLTGGEALTPEIIRALVASDKRPQHILNCYGPTESTTIATVWHCEAFTGSVPLGKPINTREVYVLDCYGRLAPMGTIGEVYIGGEGLASGYLNRPDLTAERFVSTAFGRLYKTGDLGRWLPDGNLEYLGRNDFQVKIRGFRVETAEVESHLVAHESISQAVVVADTSAGGASSSSAGGASSEISESRLVAYCRTTETEQNRVSDIVADWETLYNDLYQDGRVDDTFDISGWNCSFTGMPIPEPEMREWMEATVSRVSSLGGQRILEIGCGTGLLMYPLLDHCKSYTGMDFSAKVVARLKAAIKQQGIKHAQVYQGFADQLGELEGSFDTVVINSVVQYFPSVEYLEAVIDKSLQRIDEGHLFIGDVRDLRLLEHFNQATGRHQDEDELLVDPHYFMQLASRFPQIAEVQVMPKMGLARHEMNLYRYDVVIRVGVSPGNSQPLPILAWSEDAFEAISEPVCIKGYPNERLVEHNNLLRLADITVLAEEKGLPVTAYLNLDDATCLDLVFGTETQAYFEYVVTHKTNEPLANALLTNSPVKRTGRFDFEPVKAFLQRRLPHFMIPSLFIKVESFALLANGKIDLKALPKPEIMGKSGYMPPRNELEKTLCHVWQNVLGVESVGIDDSYFDLGGNSINAIRLCAACAEALGRELPIAVLFELKTIGQLAQRLDRKPVVISHIESDRYPLSFAQERLYVIANLDHAATAYQSPCLVKLDTDIDTPALMRALKAMVARHEILRTVIREDEKGQLFQQVLTDAFAIDWRQLDGHVNVWETVKEDIDTPFELSQQPAFKVKGYIQNDCRYLLLMWHHIAFDGWSSEVFFNDLRSLYRGDSLPPLEITYGDYARWQREQLNLAPSLEYWQTQLSGFENLDLPLDKPRPLQFDYQGAIYSFTLDKTLSNRLRALAQSQQTTLYTVLLSGFSVTLANLSGQTDIVIGSPSENRSHHQTQPLLGFFVNSLVMRARVEPDLTVKELLSRVHQTVTQAKTHQELPFEKLVQTLDIERDPSRHPIYQVLFSVQNFAEQSIKHLPFEPENSGTLYHPAKFDLDLLMSDGDSEIKGILSFATSLFECTTIENLVDIYRQVLAAFAAGNNPMVGEIVVWDAPKQQPATPVSGSLVALFEATVAANPDKTALIFDGQTLTYRELNERANRLAHDVEQGKLIALYLDRSFETVVSILAVLKAGSAYVPVAIDYPKARIEFILQDSQACQVLTQKRYAHQFDNPVVVDDIQAGSPRNPGRRSGLAYVLYTSGTTGHPKGVMVEQASVVNLIKAQTKAFAFTEDEQVALVASYVFDASVEQMWLALLSGATLHIPSEAQIKSGKVLNAQITHLHATPGYLATLEVPEHNLKRVVSGGDVCPAVVKRIWGDLLINEYGPTEATVTAVQCLNYGNAPDNCIGKPLKNTQVYVLNPLGKPAPVGELYIGGAGVARGYLNLPELTAERFVETEWGRLYRSGDKVRWLADGSLAFLGRLDNQVKIRGIRIELLEIENTLREWVKQAVVTARGDGIDKYLCAYVVADAFDEAACRNYLSEKLPPYMVPTRFVPMDQIPLAASGKVDVRQLPDPVRGDAVTAPRTQREQRLCEIWQKMLGLEKVGVEENFFSLGGNSITAIKLCKAISDAFGVEVPLSLLFEQQTIAGMAARLGDASVVSIPHIEQDRYPLSFAQERMLFIEQYTGGSDLYHVPSVVRLHKDVDVDRLLEAVERVAERHPIMRTLYRDGMQVVSGRICCKRTFLNVDRLNGDRLNGDWVDALQAEVARPFDLTREPGLRLHWYQGQQDYLLILWHHIAFDGWSAGIFGRELALVYAGETLPPLSITYGDYARWQRQSLDVQAQIGYWQGQLNDVEGLSLPTDYPRPANIDYRGANIPFELDEALSAQLRELARENRASLYSVLLSGFYLLLARLSGQQDIVVGTPSDNRIQGQTHDLIGLFINPLALRIKVDSTVSVKSFIVQVQQVVMDGKRHQELPFEQLVEALKVQRDTSRHPIFQVMFSSQWDTDDLQGHGLPFTPVALEELSNPAKFDLSLIVIESTRIRGVFNYAISLFKRTTVVRFAEIYRKVLQAFVEDATQQIGLINTLSDKDRLLQTLWNQNHIAFPMENNLHQRFEWIADRSPEIEAIYCDGKSVSYGELNRRANQVANQIQVKIGALEGGLEGALVSLYFDRSVEMIVSLLAVLKSGAAYVPMSPGDPQARIEYMLQDTQSPLVLTHSQYADRFSGLHVLAVDKVADDGSGNPVPRARGEDLAYVIYTSGTTGKPKGVMVEHRNLLNYAFNLEHSFGNAFDRVDFSTHYCFDLSVTTSLCPLLFGRTVCIYTGALSDVDQYRRHLREARVNFIKTTPGLARLLLPDQGVETLVVGGEALTGDGLRALKPKASTLYDEYGPTEATVGATLARVWPEGQPGIGKAYANVQLYVLNELRQPLPIGAPGELYIGGECVARGYLNQPELTEDKFVESSSGRLYRTGDWVRWREDGNLEYLGRTDSQLKINGYRVEPGEVQALLGNLPGVVQAAVVENTRNDRTQLAAYVVLDMNVVLDADVELAQIRTMLASDLPHHMIPVSIHRIDGIPLTVNGKLDKERLPEPVMQYQEYVPPRNRLERDLCEILQRLLGLNQIGIDDNFFELGGNSMLVMQAITSIRQTLNIRYSVRRFYTNPTIRQMAAGVRKDQVLVLEQEVSRYEFLQVPTNEGNYLNHAIFLSGATGFIGRYLLAGLLKNTEFRIYCLVRADSAEAGLERIKSKMKSYGIWQERFIGRIEAVPGNLAQPNMGLSATLYERLAVDVAHVYHCATYMDHLATYDQMKSVNVDGTYAVLKFACYKRPKKLEYLSTQDVFNREQVRAVYEKTAIDNELHFSSNGYNATKWIAEKLVMMTNERGLDANIYRLGLVTGDTVSGKNDPSQWFGGLIASCHISGCCFNENHLNLNLTPVDFVAETVFQLSVRSARGEVYHISHPEQVSFTDLVKMYNADNVDGLELVPYSVFVSKLKSCMDAGVDIPIAYRVAELWHPHEEGEAREENEKSNPRERLSLNNAYTTAILQQAGLRCPEIKGEWIKRYFNNWK